jgi:hypothetical protein
MPSRAKRVKRIAANTFKSVKEFHIRFPFLLVFLLSSYLFFFFLLFALFLCFRLFFSLRVFSVVAPSYIMWIQGLVSCRDTARGRMNFHRFDEFEISGRTTSLTYSV